MTRLRERPLLALLLAKSGEVSCENGSPTSQSKRRRSRGVARTLRRNSGLSDEILIRKITFSCIREMRQEVRPSASPAVDERTCCLWRWQFRWPISMLQHRRQWLPANCKLYPASRDAESRRIDSISQIATWGKYLLIIINKFLIV